MRLNQTPKHTNAIYAKPSCDSACFTLIKHNQIGMHFQGKRNACRLAIIQLIHQHRDQRLIDQWMNRDPTCIKHLLRARPLSAAKIYFFLNRDGNVNGAIEIPQQVKCADCREVGDWGRIADNYKIAHQLNPSKLRQCGQIRKEIWFIQMHWNQPRCENLSELPQRNAGKLARLATGQLAGGVKRHGKLELKLIPR